MLQNAKRVEVEVGIHAGPQSGGLRFMRCAACGRGFHVNMWDSRPKQCPDCLHVHTA